MSATQQRSSTNGLTLTAVLVSIVVAVAGFIAVQAFTTVREVAAVEREVTDIDRRVTVLEEREWDTRSRTGMGTVDDGLHKPRPSQ